RPRLPDRLPSPAVAGALGPRGGWMLVTQLMIVAGLVLMALVDPVRQITLLAAAAVLVAFFSATQDIVIDAYRIEAVEAERQGAMAAMYTYGYRLAVIVSVAGALYVAEFVSWPAAYLAMAACMGIGIA